MAPKHKNREAGNLDMPKRRFKVYAFLGKRHGLYSVWHYQWFQVSTGWSWNVFPLDKGVLLYWRFGEDWREEGEEVSIDLSFSASNPWCLLNSKSDPLAAAFKVCR